MRIYLIRHGQTDWNTQGKIQGGQDILLNDAGRRQAEQLAEAMDSHPVSRIFSSTLMRAMETAQIIGRRKNMEISPMSQLMEVSYGRWEGMTREEIQSAYPEEYRRWFFNPAHFSPPGGESQTDIMKRCLWSIKEIIKITGGREDVAVVSHGATVDVLISCMKCGDPEDEKLIVDNASITTIHYSPLTEDFMMLEINNTSHLQEKR